MNQHHDDDAYLSGLGMPIDPVEPASDKADRIVGWAMTVIATGWLAGALLLGQMLDDLPASQWAADISAYLQGAFS